MGLNTAHRSNSRTDLKFLTPMPRWQPATNDALNGAESRMRIRSRDVDAESERQAVATDFTKHRIVGGVCALEK